MLTPLNGGVPFAAGTHPSAIASATDATGTYVYVTDSANGNILGYTVTPHRPRQSEHAAAARSRPAINPRRSSPIPSTLTSIVANALDGTVTAYSIGSGGALTSIGTYPTGIQPVAIGIDPSTISLPFHRQLSWRQRLRL